MKKLISVLITLGFTLTIIAPGPENVLAAEEIVEEPINIMETGDFGDYVVSEISELEYIQHIAESENISFEQAQERVELSESSEQSTMMASSDVTTSYRTVDWIQSYADNNDYKVELTVTFMIRGVDSFRQIDDYDIDAHTAPGSSTADFNPSTYYPKGTLPAIETTVGVSGNFVFTRTYSGGVTVSVPGFSSSINSGSTVTYTSNRMTMQRTYSVY